MSDPKVDDAFFLLDCALTVWDESRNGSSQPTYFQDVSPSTRVMVLGNMKLLVTITSVTPHSRDESPKA